MDKSNFVIQNILIRAESKENSHWIEGIIPYNSKSVPIWGITEIIDKTAFRKTLADKTNVKALFNHDDSKVLGTTDNGTLELENSEDGLLCRCKLPNTSYANDLYEIVSRGDVKTMSFGFIPVKWEDTNNGKLRTLKEVKLDEVSFCVSYPAYPETSSTIRKIFMKRKIDIESIVQILEKEELMEEDITALKEIVDNINNIIKENSPKKEDEAARVEPPKEDTPPKTDTPPKEEDKEKEEVKQEIFDLIETLFEIEKETSDEEEPKKETK